jgi:hypothetical protein
MIRSNRSPFAALCGAVLVFYSAITESAEDPAAVTATPGSGLILSDAVLIGPSGGRNPNVAVDPNTGAVYLAWAQEAIDATPAPGSTTRCPTIAARAFRGP